MQSSLAIGGGLNTPDTKTQNRHVQQEAEGFCFIRRPSLLIGIFRMKKTSNSCVCLCVRACVFVRACVRGRVWRGEVTIVEGKKGGERKYRFNEQMSE